MHVESTELTVPKEELNISTLHNRFMDSDYVPIRFLSSTLNESTCSIEVDSIYPENYTKLDIDSIFSLKKRGGENTDAFTAVLIIPTGIDAQIGGHCGDASVLARYIASACDTLITHPNVVNAADFNELTDNTLYVEGSTITRLLMGQIGLKKVRANRMCVIMDTSPDRYINTEIVNAVSTARMTLGLDCDVLEIPDLARYTTQYSSSGRVIGQITNLEHLFHAIEKVQDDYDTFALTSFINVPEGLEITYFKDDTIINPWGGIEAMLTHACVEHFKKPFAHSPMGTVKEVYDKIKEVGIIDPRKASETASITYLNCILKGLYRTPKIVSYEDGLNVSDVSCVIIPDQCVGLPVLACIEQDIPIIAVKNTNIMRNDVTQLPCPPRKFFRANNYLEAVGIMNCLKSGIAIDTIQRPIPATTYFT